KYLIDPETQRVYLCFMYIDPAITQDSAVAGVILTVADASPITFTVTQPAETPDAYLYSVEGALSIDEQHGVICELCIGVKEGLPAELPLAVRFFDAAGIPSNRYSFTVATGLGQKTTPAPAGSDTPAEDKTTKSKPAVTTTEEYFKHDSGPVYTYNYNYTAARRTTAASTTASTAAQTIAPKETKATKKQTMKAERAPSIPAAEKSTQTEAPAREVVIISEVYVTAEPTTGIPPESVRLYAKGHTLQTALTAAVAVMLTALAAFAATAGRRRSRSAPRDGADQTGRRPD
ncbi:MAG: hypothetical protein IKD72_10045, partial [Clostridia bacterium]|nr:hypothetical protein [Clostridia bacterium]